jgi:hypothetical protein
VQYSNRGSSTTPPTVRGCRPRRTRRRYFGETWCRPDRARVVLLTGEHHFQSWTVPPPCGYFVIVLSTIQLLRGSRCGLLPTSVQCVHCDQSVRHSTSSLEIETKYSPVHRPVLFLFQQISLEREVSYTVHLHAHTHRRGILLTRRADTLLHNWRRDC